MTLHTMFSYSSGSYTNTPIHLHLLLVSRNRLTPPVQDESRACLHYIIIAYEQNTVWPEILVGNLFWRIGDFESNPPIFQLQNFTVCVIITVKL